MTKEPLEPLGFQDARALSDAEMARTLLASHDLGTLSTLATDPPGHPFGSQMPYVLDHRGDPIMLASSLAEHTQNFLADQRASLFVSEAKEGNVDPLALQRVTLLGRVREAGDEVRDLYLAKHTSARGFSGFKDFSFYLLEVETVRYVGGFGRMSWFSVEDYRRAEPDPIAGSASDITRHMNEDHSGAILELCADTGKVNAKEAIMTSVDRYGFEVRTVEDGGSRRIRISFERPVRDAEGVRVEIIRLLRAARKQIGADSVGH